MVSTTARRSFPRTDHVAKIRPDGSMSTRSGASPIRPDLLERAARAAQINTFGGGVNEVQREIVAAAGLGMARQAR